MQTTRSAALLGLALLSCLSDIVVAERLAFCDSYQLTGGQTELACPRDFNPICGTDGVTYPNECSLCREYFRNRGLGKRHDGRCVKLGEPGLLNQPGFRPRFRPGFRSGFRPGLEPGLQTGFGPSLQPGLEPGLEPGLQPGFQPGLQPGLVPGLQTGLGPSLQPGLEPGLEPGLQPGLEPGLQTGLGPSLQPGLEPGLQPGLQPGLVPGLQTGLGPSLQPGLEPGVQPGLQPELQPGINNMIDCSDQKSSNLVCAISFDPLCGSNGKTYKNKCEFCKAVLRNEGTLFLRHRGRC